MMTDQNQNTVWEGEFLPFGEAYSITGTVTNNFRFPGQYYEEEMGLNYNNRRTYNPYLGRYIEKDPIGLSGGINPYIYARNRPLNLTDPLGLFCTADFVNHYFYGGGTAVDLGSVGLLDTFRNSSSVSHSVFNFKMFTISSACQGKAKSICKDCQTGIQKASFPVNSNDTTDVTWEPCLFSVGDSTFFRSANCNLTANCSNKTFQYSCSATFSIKDWFKEPVDIPHVEPGTPYQINASWSESLSGMGSF